MFRARDHGQLVDIKRVQSNQVQIINGQQVIQYNYCLCCPVCGKIIYVFDEPGLTELDIQKVCADQVAQLHEIAEYCSGCGQKLLYKREIVDEVN